MGNQKQASVCRNQLEDKTEISNSFYTAQQNAKIDIRSLRKAKLVNKFIQLTKKAIICARVRVLLAIIFTKMFNN